MGEDRCESKEHVEVSPDAPSLSEDRLYRALVSRQRRRLLFALLEDEELSIEESATLLVGWGATESGLMASQRDYEETQMELVHNHLPMLDDAGFLEYDRENDIFRLKTPNSRVQTLIRRSVETRPPDRT